eukprot:g2848.t1
MRTAALLTRSFSAAAKQTYSAVEGSGSSAVLFGGFAFGPRQMAKHAALYESHGFHVHHCLSPGLQGIKDLTTPVTAQRRGAEIAKEVLAQGDRPICLHAISGSVWTMIYMLDALPKEWRDRHVRAIFFDSCPPMSDTLAFGGFVEFFFKRKGLRELSAPLFQPYRALCGIDAEWEAANRRRMFGEEAVIPRGAHCLFMHGRNDPVLNPEYLTEFIEDIRRHREDSNVMVSEATFEKTRHSLAIIEEPEPYKLVHISNLLRKVPEWRLGTSVAEPGQAPRLSLKDYEGKLVVNSARYRSNDVSKIFVQFNRNRDGWLDFTELRNGLARIFGLHSLDPNLLWETFRFGETSRRGKLTLEEFAERLEVDGGVSLVDTGMSTGTHEVAATPRQDKQASFRHLRAAAAQDPTRQDETAMPINRDSVIHKVVEKLQRTEMSMRKLFKEMDASHNNRIDAKELLGAVRACGAPEDAFGIEQANMIISFFDRNQDGCLSFSEFVRLLAFTGKEEDEREHPSGALSGATVPSIANETTPAYSTTRAVRAAAARSSQHRAASTVSKKMGLSKNFSSKEYRAIKNISDAVYGSRRKVRNLFRLMDQNGDRKVDVAELQAGISECGLEMHLEDLSQLVSHFNSGQKLGYSDFIKLLASKE